MELAALNAKYSDGESIMGETLGDDSVIDGNQGGGAMIAALGNMATMWGGPGSIDFGAGGGGTPTGGGNGGGSDGGKEKEEKDGGKPGISMKIGKENFDIKKILGGDKAASQTIFNGMFSGMVGGSKGYKLGDGLPLGLFGSGVSKDFGGQGRGKVHNASSQSSRTSGPKHPFTDLSQHLHMMLDVIKKLRREKQKRNDIMKG